MWVFLFYQSPPSRSHLSTVYNRRGFPLMRFFLAFLSAACVTIAADGPQFTPAGQLSLPKDYRQWIYLSSGLGMTYGPAAQANPGNPLFDNVFVNPSSYRAFLDT